MVSKITFSAIRDRNEIVIKKMNAAHVESSWKRLTDTAEITLPRNVSYFNKHKIGEVFKKGDPVKIELGYNGNYVTEFEGYVSKVSADIPIIIKCEDEMYNLKKRPVNVSLQNTTLPKLLKTILPGVKIDALDVEIGSHRFPKTTVAQVLEYFKDEYSLYSYFQNGVLYCGKVYEGSPSEAVKLHLEKNVVNQDLNYKNKEDVQIVITAVSTLPNGNKIEVSVGDEEGEQRQLSYYGITLEAELTRLANEDLKKYKVDGFTGTVTTFGIPIITHGMKVTLNSELYPDRSGVYYVQEVIVDYTPNAEYRRQIVLGDKVTV